MTRTRTPACLMPLTRTPRTSRLPCLLAALALSVSGVGLGAAHAAGKDSKEMARFVGKPVSSTRSTLIAEGWEPIETALTTSRGAPERERGEAGKLLEAGYPEIERCTGSGGRTYCFLNYGRRGKCLRVRTVGVLQAPESEPKVHGVGDACPSKQGKR